MAMLLKIVGGLWAVVGVANLVAQDWSPGNSAMLSFAFIFNGILFVLPGLALFGVGAAIGRRSTSSNVKPAENVSIEGRLDRLSKLKRDEHISQEEYDARRAEILRGV